MRESCNFFFLLALRDNLQVADCACSYKLSATGKRMDARSLLYVRTTIKCMASLLGTAALTQETAGIVSEQRPRNPATLVTLT